MPGTAAVAFDGSVWLANNATGTDTTDVNNSNVVHLDVFGNLICRAPVLHRAHGVAVDDRGDIWALSYDNGDLHHISGTQIDLTTSPPTCVIIETIATLAVNSRGLTVAYGSVWTASSPFTLRIDCSNTLDMEYVPNPSHYGITPDANGRIWHSGGVGVGTVHSFDATTNVRTDGNVDNVTALTTHPNGTLWGTRYSVNQIVGIDANSGTALCGAPMASGTNPNAIAVDGSGRIWMVPRYGGGDIHVYDDQCILQFLFPAPSSSELVGEGNQDWTGNILRNFTAPGGIRDASWFQEFDTGETTAYFSTLEWDSIEPSGTAIELSVQTADATEELSAAPGCGPFSQSPVDLSTCPAGLQYHRYARITAHLSRNSATVTQRPVLTALRLGWAY